MPRSLVTMALPYANGSLHLGHLVEGVQTDIYVRALRAMGREVAFICASDTHGTPIEVNAAKAGVPPAEFVARYHAEHQRDYKAFDVEHSRFYTTNSPENERRAVQIYEALRAEGAIDRRDVEQFYCEIDKRFLPDRFVRGTCPKCGAPDQYGDACEKCGSTYEPTDLKDPYCSLCMDQGRGRVPPVRRTSAHYFVQLSKYQAFLEEWTARPGALQPEIRRSIDGWLSAGLKDWDISRDAPYFGFKIPGEDAKYFYVWLDAPVGYLSSTEKWAEEQGRDFRDYWGKDADCEVEHFIGKDIVYFHTLFWPAMLHAGGWKVPKRVHVHGMLTVEGEKMSKSRGTMVSAAQYVDAGLDPEWLRYFYAGNLGTGPSDIDLSFGELKNRVNGELLGNVGNLANRALSILWKSFGGELSRVPEGSAELLQHLQTTEAAIADCYRKLDTRGAIQLTLAVGSSANERLQRTQPWKLLATDRAAAQAELTLAVNVARFCARWLSPVVPRLASGVEAQTGAPLRWGDFTWLQDAKIAEPRPLVRKVEDAELKKLTDTFAPRAAAGTQPSAAKPAPRPEATGAADATGAIGAIGATSAAGAAAHAQPAAQAAAAAPISIEQFALVDLRAGKVLACERVPRKDKLLKLTVDVGEGTPRTIASGVALSYKPEELVGKTVVVVANLPPRDFGKGLVSHGMLLYSGGGARENTAVELPGDVQPGAKVK